MKPKRFAFFFEKCLSSFPVGMAIHTDPPSHLLSLSEMSYLLIFSTALWFYFAAVFPVETKPAVPCAELFLLYHHFVTSVIPLPYEVL